MRNSKKVLAGAVAVAAMSGLAAALPASAQALAVVSTAAYYGTYDGQSHGLSSAKIAGAGSYEVFYSTKKALSKGNYKTEGTRVAPRRTKTGTTKVYLLYKYKPTKKAHIAYVSQTSSINVLMPAVRTSSTSTTYDGKAHSAWAACDDKSCKVYYSAKKLTVKNCAKVGTTKAPARTKVGTTKANYLVVPDGATKDKECAKGTVSVKIGKRAMSMCAVSGFADSYTYTGSKISPKPTVCNLSGKSNLKEGRDYTVKYYDNKAVGKATAVIKGKGSYTGSKTVTYKISALNIASCDISKLGVLTMPEDGSPLCPKPTVSLKGAKIYESDYKVSWESNDGLSAIGWVILTGKGNLTGTVRVPFGIE